MKYLEPLTIIAFFLGVFVAKQLNKCPIKQEYTIELLLNDSCKVYNNINVKTIKFDSLQVYIERDNQ